MSKIFSYLQIKEWDNYTIKNEFIPSVQLMKRAAKCCTEWIIKKWPNKDTHFSIFCGNGNNGGDGLVMATLLIQYGYELDVFITEKNQRSEENTIVLDELFPLSRTSVHIISNVENIKIKPSNIIIDALFGSGLNKSVGGIEKELILFLNGTHNIVVSIDYPSGLFSEPDVNSETVVNATYTLTFQQIKLPFLFAESGQHCGKVIIIDIGLHPKFEKETSSSNYFLQKKDIKVMYQSRTPFSNKGNYGKCLLIVGSRGMMGAAILAAKACLRIGTGLVNVLVPETELPIIQQQVPETLSTLNYQGIDKASLLNFNVIGIGSGLGISSQSIKLVDNVLEDNNKPLLIDADALNIIAEHKNWLSRIPRQSILTPHPKEFDRLFGSSKTSFDRNQLQVEMSIKYKLYILVKGKYTSISTPSGDCYFNSTGNAGMAKGGSGDVLSGIISGLMAQYRNVEHAVLMGVYLHGFAGDLAADHYSEESMLPTDIIENLGRAFRRSFY